ncbi:MAG: hypothetical protein U9Q83_01025, partial [Bacteroidota bacterium]|nr:hypothetical protein [Bacteroidota bacterium]
MTKKFFSLIIILSLAFSSVFSQTKQLTLEDAVWNQYFSLRPASVSQLQWIGDSYNYSYIEKWSEIHSKSVKS